MRTEVAPITPLQEIGLIVVNYGSHQLIEANLGADILDAGTVRVIIVDNFSSLDELAAITALALSRNWTLVCSPDNVGFGAAMNIGVAKAEQLGCVCFLLLNPDAVVGNDVVAELREHCLREPMSMISPIILRPDGTSYFRGSGLQLDDGRIRSSPSSGGHRVDSKHRPEGGPVQQWLTGACLAMHRDLFDKLGGFDDRFFLYWEDVDLSYRTSVAGGALVVRSDLVAVHDEGGTQGPREGRAKSSTYYYFNCRNRLMFAAAHLSRRELTKWLLLTPVVSWEILMQGGRRQLLNSPRPLLAALRGSAAGLGIGLRALVARRPAKPGPPSTVSRSTARSRSYLIAHPSADLYGSDRVMLETIDALRSLGGQVVVTVPVEGPLIAEIQARGARVVICRVPVLRKSVLTPRGFLVFGREALMGLVPAVRLVLRAGSGGVFVNTITVPSWLVIGRLLGRRVTCHVHEAEQSASPLTRRLLYLPTGFAQNIVVNSQFSLDVLGASLPSTRKKSTVLYNSVPGPPRPIAARSSIVGPARVLFIGRLSARKGPQVAIAAVSQLRSRGVDVQLDLLGSVYPGYEWFQDDLITAVSDAGLNGLVRFLGFDSDIWPYLEKADIVVVPSILDEPFGNTAVEAVLAGRPLITSATSGLIEAAAGYPSVQMVEPGDAGALADAIETVMMKWPLVSHQAWSDSATARERHSSSRYAQGIVSVAAPRGGHR